jgi:hypothetical protein
VPNRPQLPAIFLLPPPVRGVTPATTAPLAFSPSLPSISKRRSKTDLLLGLFAHFSDTNYTPRSDTISAWHQRNRGRAGDDESRWEKPNSLVTFFVAGNYSFFMWVRLLIEAGQNVCSDRKQRRKGHQEVSVIEYQQFVSGMVEVFFCKAKVFFCRLLLKMIGHFLLLFRDLRQSLSRRAYLRSMACKVSAKYPRLVALRLISPA